ncbi:hypothetical protein [Kiloniella majae]|uniref:hypothetical protein n=1 Tax=Kiloniella majae TaxID=1938558 RepID=UPI000A27765F|nr:hypothetical protein [Kiloniella majae]
MGLDRFWWGLIVIFIGTNLFFHFFILDGYNLPIQTFSFFGFLLAGLLKLFRDDMRRLDQLQLQKNDQIFSIGATSHMANTIFDKHVEFREKYLILVNKIEHDIWRHGPTEHILEKANALSRLRLEFTPWISTSITSKLKPFEKEIRELGANAGLAKNLRRNEKDRDIYQEVTAKVHDSFKGMVSENEDENPFVLIRKNIREILQVDQLADIRSELIKKASAPHE